MSILFRFSLILMLTFFLSCSDSEKRKLIIGKWKCIEWFSTASEEVNDVDNTSFEFKEDGTYTYINDILKENGTFKIRENNLYTTPQGEAEIMVNIAHITKDSLCFEMNRGGVIEKMVLIKR